MVGAYFKAIPYSEMRYKVTVGPVYNQIIRTYTEFKFRIQRPGIRFKPGYKQAGISQNFIPTRGRYKSCYNTS